jgi:hypothetical protein
MNEYATLDELKTWYGEDLGGDRNDEVMAMLLETASRQIDSMCDQSFYELDEVPAAVKLATLIQATRLLKRRETPEGAMGFGDLGAVRLSGKDPDVERLLAPLKKLSFGSVTE